MTGFGTSAFHFGLPDRGLLTMTEMVQNASRIVNAINIPLIADADTGYGTIINVNRTMKEYEKAGVAAIQIEDQVWPKRCGHMLGKEVISEVEMVNKIKTAVEAKKNSDFLIIARTDAIATHGFDHAIERANIYAEAGADIIFVEAPTTKNQVEQIPALKNQSDMALLGLRIQFALVPMIIILIAFISFLILYDLTPEKNISNKLKLKELGL